MTQIQILVPILSVASQVSSQIAAPTESDPAGAFHAAMNLAPKPFALLPNTPMGKEIAFDGQSSSKLDSSDPDQNAVEAEANAKLDGASFTHTIEKEALFALNDPVQLPLAELVPAFVSLFLPVPDTGVAAAWTLAAPDFAFGQDNTIAVPRPLEPESKLAGALQSVASVVQPSSSKAPTVEEPDRSIGVAGGGGDQPSVAKNGLFPSALMILSVSKTPAQPVYLDLSDTTLPGLPDVRPTQNPAFPEVGPASFPERAGISLIGPSVETQKLDTGTQIDGPVASGPAVVCEHDGVVDPEPAGQVSRTDRSMVRLEAKAIVQYLGVPARPQPAEVPENPPANPVADFHDTLFDGAEVSQEETVLRAIWAGGTAEEPDSGLPDRTIWRPDLSFPRLGKPVDTRPTPVNAASDSTCISFSKNPLEGSETVVLGAETPPSPNRPSVLDAAIVVLPQSSSAAFSQSELTRPDPVTDEIAQSPFPALERRPAGSVKPDVPPATVPLPSPHAQIVQAATSVGEPVTELRLSPEELGNVRIEMRSEGERMVMTISAERQDTLDLLRRHADQLAAELRVAGQSGVSVAFGRWTGSGDGSTSGGQTQGAMPESPELETETPPAPISVYRPVGSAAGLYLRV